MPGCHAEWNCAVDDIKLTKNKLLSLRSISDKVYVSLGKENKDRNVFVDLEPLCGKVDESSQDCASICNLGL